jgi:hypothetical protein
MTTPLPMSLCASVMPSSTLMMVISGDVRLYTCKIMKVQVERILSRGWLVCLLSFCSIVICIQMTSAHVSMEVQ